MSLSFIRTFDKIQETDPKKFRLCEIYDKNVQMPEFAILSEDGIQICTWMKCKDYIQDTILGGMFEKDTAVYGWVYKHGQDAAPAKHRLILAIRFKGKEKELPGMLMNVKATVENLEKRIKFPKHSRTRFSRVLQNKYFVIYGSKMWMHSTHLVSFFSFLLRASLCNSGGTIETIGKTCPVKKDIYYNIQGNRFVNQLLKKGIAGWKPNWETFNNKTNGGWLDVHGAHNSGFLAYLGNLDVDDMDDLDEDDDF